MKKWFKGLKSSTKTWIVVSMWVLLIAIAYIAGLEQIENNEKISTILDFAIIIILVIAIIVSCWSKDKNKAKRKNLKEKSKTFQFVKQQQKKEFRQYFNFKDRLGMDIIFIVIAIVLGLILWYDLKTWLAFAIGTPSLIVFWILMKFFIYGLSAANDCKVYFLDGVEIGAGYVKSTYSPASRSFELFFVIGDNINQKSISVRSGNISRYTGTAWDVFDVLLDLEDSIKMCKETKAREDIVKLKEKLGDKEITLVVEKYTRYMKLFVDGLAIEKYLENKENDENCQIKEEKEDLE